MSVEEHLPSTQRSVDLASRRDKSTAEHSPVDSGTPPEQEVQGELTGDRQLSTHLSEDTAVIWDESSLQQLKQILHIGNLVPALVAFQRHVTIHLSEFLLALLLFTW
ncbi:hypothetical protein UY3_13643 [Chelonia mydas]|uniref:Uncharacterized protein n=1 Tax=Chelonia mydas TaxID=8469 RepID=M7AUY0_CHEMY|nr:hypothetical protein UY3_13643 [Chelonia mydas]